MSQNSHEYKACIVFQPSKTSLPRSAKRKEIADFLQACELRAKEFTASKKRVPQILDRAYALKSIFSDYPV